MRTAIIALLMAPLLLWGDAGQSQKKPASKPAQQAGKQVKAAEIPPDAVEIEPGVYRWKDGQGKSWILRKSPFGILKGEENPARESQSGELPAGLKVTEEGDELLFERPTPFGTVRWRKKKDELNEMEQQAWEREQKSRAAQKAKE